MSEILTFHLTQEDIFAAKRYGLRNALLYLICNRTGTLWRMTGCGVGMEIMSPYRTLRFCEEDACHWQLYQTDGLFLPCRLSVEIHPYGARRDTSSVAMPQPIVTQRVLAQRVLAQRVLAQTSEQIAGDPVTLTG